MAKSVSFVVTLMAVFLLAPAPRAQEHAPTAHHGFGDVAHWAGIFESADRAKWQKPDEVVRALDLKPGQTVIDIGAGTGYFTRRFAKAVGPSGAVIGLDVEPGMVDYMKADAKKLGLQNYHARVVKADDPELLQTQPMSSFSATHFIMSMTGSLICASLLRHSSPEAALQ